MLISGSLPIFFLYFLSVAQSPVFPEASLVPPVVQNALAWVAPALWLRVDLHGVRSLAGFVQSTFSALTPRHW